MLIDVIKGPRVCAIEHALDLAFISNALIFLGHGCNCQCVMGAGFAKILRDRFPQVAVVDKEFSKVFTAHDRLGRYSETFTEVDDNKVLGLINFYSQFKFLPHGLKHFNPDALRNALDIFHQEKGSKTLLVIPTIGCGLAGGDLEKDLMPILVETPVKIILVKRR